MKELCGNGSQKQEATIGKARAVVNGRIAYIIGKFI